jgi:hypothetical protein
VAGPTIIMIRASTPPIDIDFLFEDDLSTSTPHIFSDSPNSSISSGDWYHNRSTHSNRPTPHMFLSYANPSTFAKSFRRKSNREAPVSERKSSHSRHKHRKSSSTSSAHLFLDYANDKPEEQKSASRGPHQPRVKRQVHQHEVDEFQFRCQEALLSQQGFSAYHASTAAKALSKAAEAAASSTSSDNSEDVFSLYRSAIRKAVTAQPEALADCNESMNMSQVFLEHGNGSSTSLSCQSQNDELMFLRLAVKELLFQLPAEDPLVPRENKKKNAFPSNIEFHQLEVMDDDITEATSLVFSHDDAEGGETQELASTANLPILEKTPSRIGFVGTPSMPLPPLNLSDHHRDPYGNSLTKTESTESWRYMQTIQTLFATRPSSQTSKYSLMEKGEIYGDRARGIQWQVTIRGIPFDGTYNGSLKDGVPEGPGVLRFHNRDLYIGDFTNGSMHGEGALFCRKQAKVVVLRGRFDSNEFVGTGSDESISAGAA